MEPFKILNISDAEYRALPYLAQSDLVWMLKSPRHFQMRNELRGETKAMNFGTAFHTAFLQPKLFKDSVVVEPDNVNGEVVNKRLKAHREYLDAWKKEHESKIVISNDELDRLTRMLQEMGKNKKLFELFQGGQPEVAATWNYMGYDCKGRVDYFIPDHPIYGPTVIELKKTQCASPHAFARSMINYNYDVQLAYYVQGFRAKNHFIVAVEDEFPNGIGIYNSHQWLEIGKKKMDRLFMKLADCEQRDSWPSYTDGIEPLLPPTWAVGADKEENFEL